MSTQTITYIITTAQSVAPEYRNKAVGMGFVKYIEQNFDLSQLSMAELIQETSWIKEQARVYLAANR